jgi:hypothetical protein
MNKLLSAAVMTALMTAALPGWAQSASPQTGTQMRSDQSIAPGAGGVSKPDEPGLPGTKSGPSVTPSGRTVAEQSQLKQSGDESHVQGLPGNKSGPAVKPPQTGR